MWGWALVWAGILALLLGGPVIATGPDPIDTGMVFRAGIILGLVGGIWWALGLSSRKSLDKEIEHTKWTREVTEESASLYPRLGPICIALGGSCVFVALIMLIAGR